MKKLLYAVPLLLTLFIASCEQEDEILNLASSSEADVQPFEMQANAKGFIGRIAISADGNDHDRDDIGATPMGLAILAHFGLQNKVVHYDYNSHIWGNGSGNQKKEMTESALGAASRFGFNKSAFISAIDETNKAKNSIANAINNSSSSNPLYLLVAGPMAVACEGIQAADQDKRKYVTVISHSSWNNEYSQKGSYTANDVKKTGVKFVQIKDQNAGLHKRYEVWSWLKNHSNGGLRWVYERMKVSDKPRGDVSDAGMIWYLLKNDQNVDPDKLKSFFASGAPTVDPKDNDNDNGSGSNDKNCQASGSTLAQAIKNLQKACGITYNKNKGHDCDPDGKGGWICSTGDL